MTLHQRLTTVGVVILGVTLMVGLTLAIPQDARGTQRVEAAPVRMVPQQGSTSTPTKTRKPTKTPKPSKTPIPTHTPFRTNTPGSVTATPTPTTASFTGKSCLEVNHFSAWATAPTPEPIVTPGLYDQFRGEHVNSLGIDGTTYRVEYRLGALPTPGGTPQAGLVYVTGWTSAYGNEQRVQYCGVTFTKAWLWRYHVDNVDSKYYVNWRVFVENHPGTPCDSARTLKAWSGHPTPTPPAGMATPPAMAEFVVRVVRRDDDCSNGDNWNIVPVPYDVAQ
jgi:hypothetical protein